LLGLSTLVASLYVGFDFPGSFILVELLAILWPAYRTILCINMPQGRLRREWKTQWLTYWGLLAFINYLETQSIVSFFLYYLPFVNLIKLMILIYLMNPVTQGASRIYKRTIRDYLQKNSINLTYMKRTMEDLQRIFADGIQYVRHELNTGDLSDFSASPAKEKEEEFLDHPDFFV
jgi:hypothetical protein